jgi:high-affinity Fe2+/Pb2+ permease
MSWVAVAGGVLIGPVVGALAARLITDQVKPKELSSTLLIGSAVHAAAAALAYNVSEGSREENVKAFAYGTSWGSGISAGLLASGGIYFKTEAGKKAIAEHRGLGSLFPSSVSGELPEPAPGGLLGLLTAARAHGYT